MARIQGAGIAVAVVVLAVAFSGCAGLRPSRANDSTSPSASIGERLNSLAGRWQGVISETEGVYWQGATPLDLTVKADGTWQGTIGNTAASGRAEFKGDQLVLRGTQRSSSGYEEPVYLRLRGDDTRRWGETRGRFGGRDERATVSLRKTA